MTRKVMFFWPSAAALGGVAARQDRLGRWLPSVGWKPLFAVTRGRRFQAPEQFRAHYPDAEVVELDGRSGTAEGRRLACLDAIEAEQPSVVLPGAVVDCLEACAEMKRRASGPRVVFTVYDQDPATIARLAYYGGVVDFAMAVSSQTERLATEIAGFPAARTRRVTTGVESSEIAARRPTGSGPLRIGYVGRFSPEKRVMDAVALHDELRERGVDAAMELVGDGPLAAELYAAEMERPGRLSVRGAVPPGDVRTRVLRELDVLLLFSEVEGLPSVVLEAMSEGVPVVLSDFRGRGREAIFSHEETCLVFPVGDIAAAAGCVTRLSRENGLRERLVGRAMGRVAEEHSMERMTTEFVSLLEEALAQPARTDAAALEPPEGTRLGRVLGARLAERFRLLTGRTITYTGTDEWPHESPGSRRVAEEMRRRLAGAEGVQGT